MSKNLSHSHYKTVAIQLKIVAIQKIATLMDRKKTVAIASWLKQTVAIRGYWPRFCHCTFVANLATIRPARLHRHRLPEISELSLSLPASSSPSLDLLAPSSSSFQIRCTPQVFGARADRPQPSPLHLLLHYLTTIFASSTPILAVQRLHLRI
ncbi:hypothetical protein HID58_086087 [Brassica napus]|uniref:Uncharacterized protein n=1 Tax=Brassica napus TaxID=3708 RepID=A0ABQ7XPN1_BRANA|nr:hypothetical protein HID58_086087 [Brassica napus]